MPTAPHPDPFVEQLLRHLEDLLRACPSYWDQLEPEVVGVLRKRKFRRS